MLTLIQQVNLYSPKYQGVKDVLFCSNQLLAIEAEITPTPQMKVIDGTDKKLLPGFVDALVHITGGGGEGGFHTRTPQMELTDATLSGVTTVVAALGTDDVSRSLEDMLAKAYALEAEGISAYCHTGSYQVPVQTVTGSIRKDIMLLPNIIGVGELAIADHRGSHPSLQELTRIAADSRVGGMLAGKKGTVFLHLGDDEQRLDLVNEVVKESAIPASQFYATHINRHSDLLADGAKFAACGGFIDMTTSTTEEFIEQGEIPAALAVVQALEFGAPIENVSMSSDGNASLPIFNVAGEITGLEVGQVKSLFTSFIELSKLIEFDLALQTVTSSPAKALGLQNKGSISAAHDVDLVLLSSEHKIESVWAKGKLLVENGEAKIKGTFQ